jgi:hypothetical protein
MEIVRTLTPEIADEIMKERGYAQVSTIMRDNGKETDYCYAKTTDIGVCLHATVNIKRMDMSLEMVELKYFATLTMKRFDFFHKDFEKIEKIMYIYSRACHDLEPHVFRLADNMKPVENTLPTKKLAPLIKIKDDEPKEPNVPIEERKRAFWLEVAPIAKQKGLTKEFTMEFYSYWTEHGPKDRKFRKENEQKFDISKRLDTFVRNERKWHQDKTANKIEKQDQQIRTVKKPNKKDDDLF